MSINLYKVTPQRPCNPLECPGTDSHDRFGNMFDACQKAKAMQGGGQEGGILRGINASVHEPQLACYYGPLKLTRPKQQTKLHN